MQQRLFWFYDFWFGFISCINRSLATYLANYIQRHLWIAYVELMFILLVAIQLIIGGLVDLEILNINEKYIKYF